MVRTRNNYYDQPSNTSLPPPSQNQNQNQPNFQAYVTQVQFEILLNQIQAFSDVIYAPESEHQYTNPPPPPPRESNADKIGYNRREAINDKQSPFYESDMNCEEEVQSLPSYQHSEINQEYMMSMTDWQEMLDRKIQKKSRRRMQTMAQI